MGEFLSLSAATRQSGGGMSRGPAGAFQADKRVRVYDTDRDWRLVKDVHARNLRWTITDTTLSVDQSMLLYATINPVVHLVGSPPSGGHAEPPCRFYE